MRAIGNGWQHGSCSGVARILNTISTQTLLFPTARRKRIVISFIPITASCSIAPLLTREALYETEKGVRCGCEYGGGLH
jgi:hypothetical protein